MERLPDSSANAPAIFEAVELQGPMFFTSCSLVWAGGLSEEDLPICFRCLRLNLTVPFVQCNRDGWTRCGRCSYIQHAQCKDAGYSRTFRAFRTLSILLTDFDPLGAAEIPARCVCNPVRPAARCCSRAGRTPCAVALPPRIS